MFHVLVRLAIGNIVKVLATVFVTEELVSAVQLLVLLYILGAHEGHGTDVALVVVLLDRATALGHMPQIDLFLKEHLLAALADGQAFRGTFRLQLSARKAERIL